MALGPFFLRLGAVCLGVGDDPVPAVEPGPQIHQFASLAAEREVGWLGITLFVGDPEGLVADRTGVALAHGS
jgi:hypothetical protein